MAEGDQARPGDSAVTGGTLAMFDPATELGRDYAAVDWAATAAGDPSSWPSSLSNTVRLMLASRFAMWMAWGPELTFFCNDAYRRDTLGAKYPWALGRRSSEVWAEIWPDVGPRIARVTGRGESTWDEGLRLFLERSGYVEETYHTFSYSPITDDAARISGMLCVVSEDTGRVISERRIATLRDLGADLAKATTEDEVYLAAQRQLAGNPFDLPFVAAYLHDDAAGPAHLVWTTGIAPGHPAAPLQLDPQDASVPWNDAGSRLHGVPVVDDLPGRVADLPTGAWNRPPERGLVVPLGQAGEQALTGLLLVGTNPHRALDEDYVAFVELIAGQLTAAVTRARAFQAERERAEQMAALDRAKTTFFANVSHELRTPLTLLLGPAEDALEDASIGGEQRSRLEVIHRNGERLLKLVNTLLDFSRLESGRMQARYEPVDLGRYTAELASMFESAYARVGLELQVQCDPMPEPVFVDREMWAKIVLNLLSNALKATFTGGVTVRVRATDGGAELAVTDTGVGIAPQEQQRLFERFHRVVGATLRTHEGSGIGLALVAELAGLHGGTVRVDSTVGVGSTFTVEVPGGSAHLPAEQVDTTGSDAAGGAARYGAQYVAEALRWSAADDVPEPAEPAQPAGGDRPRLLVVDDNADMRAYVSGLLAGTYRIRTAPDGEAGLAAAVADPPDLVLTDVMMPKLDGFGLLSALRRDPATMHVPVIMLSARSGEDAAVEGLDAGADDYLIKPFSPRELAARVRANLELDRVRRLVAELEHSRALLVQAEQLARVGSFDLDIATGTVTGSAEFRRLVGGPDGTAATTLDDALALLHDDDRPAAVQRLEATVRTGVPLDLELRIVGDPDQRWVWVRGVIEDDGTPRLRGSVQDITERKIAEAAQRQAAAAEQAAEREHVIAHELQARLLPAPTFDTGHLDIAAFYRAGVEGTEVGGDWYDVIELDAGRTALVLGDVMGRGVQAAAVMGQLRATVRAYARIELAPDTVLQLLDDAVREISPDTIVTCVYAVYDPGDRTLSYANAGHLPPLLSAPEQPTRRLTAGGPPLGAGRGWSAPETLTLPPGATLTMYTDGLVETRDSTLDDGIGRVMALLDGPHDRVDDIPGRLVEALVPGEPDDDIAILVARISDRSRDERIAAQTFGGDEEVVGRSRDFAAASLREWDVDEDTSYDVQLIVSELITNAITHGRPPAELRLRCAAGRLYLEVHDSAVTAPRPRTARPSDDNGRGLQIVGALSERWGTRPTPTGKSVWCLVRLPVPA